MKNLSRFILILTFAVVTVACSGAGETVIEQTSVPPTPATKQVFRTPEDAITAYFAALVANDNDALIQTSAIDEMSANFNFALYTDRLKAFLPAQSLAPSTYPAYVARNKAKLTSELFLRVNMFTYSLLSEENIADGSVINIDAERTTKFIEAVDPAQLSGIALQKIGWPSKVAMQNERYKQNADAIAKVYGADESTERVALFTFKDKSYYVGFTLLRYGESWKISSLVSAIAGTNALGVPEETTPNQFDAMIN